MRKNSSKGPPHERLLHVAEVREMVGGVSKQTVYNLMQHHDLPRPYPILPNRVAWSLHEILDWIETLKTSHRAA